ncbi:MAG: hypothetical protein K8U57_09155 [Planctomycetes bacterium]|nr:hypothetical protein [Planctomycetota bacterium]
MTRFTSKKLLLSFVAIGLLSLVAAPAQAGDSVAPKAEEKAKSLVERNQRMITVFAHPTSKFHDMKYLSTEKLKDGFKVIYEVNYTAFRGYGAKFYSNLAFTFDDDGYYKTVETAGRNCTVAPFTATDAALGVIQAVIKNEPELRENFEFLKIFEKSDARDMLRFVLLLSR